MYHRWNMYYSWEPLSDPFKPITHICDCNFFSSWILLRENTSGANDAINGHPSSRDTELRNPHTGISSTVQTRSQRLPNLWGKAATVSYASPELQRPLHINSFLFHKCLPDVCHAHAPTKQRCWRLHHLSVYYILNYTVFEMSCKVTDKQNLANYINFNSAGSHQSQKTTTTYFQVKTREKKHTVWVMF